MARRRRKTGFDKFFDELMKDEEFRAGYVAARREVDRVLALGRKLGRQQKKLDT